MGLDVASELSRCPHCQAEVEPIAVFCSRCGAKLGVGATTLPPPLSLGPRSLGPRSLRPRSIAPRHEHLAQVIADPLIGATVAERYKIERMIGRGGMGVVYKVEHAKIGKVMALKLLTGELARNQDTVRRFKREALMVSKLSHPNTVQVFDYGSVGGLTYLAMEYLNGQDLGDLVEDQGPRPFPQMAKIMIQACGALQEAHQKGIVHRDIKPENLFLARTPSGEEIVKVLDFGLAKLRESRELNEITSSGNIVGTPYYMPPEQVRGEDVDPRGDVYAMCALLYTCLTGTHVFEAPSPVAVLTMQLSAEPEAPHLRCPELNISETVSQLILKGLRKDPAQRFQSATELEQAIRAELSGESLSNLHLPGSGAFAKLLEEETATRDEVERYENRLKRREMFAKAAGALLVVGTLAAGAYLYLESQKPPEFAGREREPNHEVESATKVPFDSKVLGQLGKRLGDHRGDQDNYSIDIPANAGSGQGMVEVNLSGLPNMGTCIWIFSAGQQEPAHRLCSGAAGRGIHVPQLALRAGTYLFVVKQDLDKYTEADAPLLHENVSDDYELRIGPAKSIEGLREVEPNENPVQTGASASPQPKIELGAEGASAGMRGALSTMRDQDIVCVTGSGMVQFVIYDAEGGARPLSAALQATPLGGPSDKIPVRVHGGRQGIEFTERDQPSPWRGPPTDASENPCIKLELVANPWAPRPHPLIAPASDHEWRVVAEPMTGK